MPYTNQTSDFWGWYLRHNNRLVWKHMADAGLDLFASGPNNNPQAFLQLDNLLPAVNGGFNRRWGTDLYLSQAYSNGTLPVGVVRTFLYNQAQDASNPSNTANTNLIIGTDNKRFYTYTDVNPGTYTGFKPVDFASVGNTQAVTSRGWFYYGNNTVAPRKVNPSYTTNNTDSLLGIALPIQGTPPPNQKFLSYPSVWPANVSNLIGVTTYQLSSGYGYTAPPTVTITDPTGSGTGGAITCSIGVHGEVIGFSITPGSGYKEITCTLSAPPAGGRQAYIVAYIQTNTGAPNAGQIVGADFAGPMHFVAGRYYTVALQNSLTGHTSDVFVTDLPVGSFKTGPSLNGLTGIYNSVDLTTVTNIPVFLASNSSSTSYSAGVTQNEIIVSVPQNNLDPQVDTVLVVATSDGGSLGTLYEVVKIPLSSFTLASGYYQYYYVDILPDSYDDANVTGNTLLAANTWAFTDSDGTSFGILQNTPPITTGFLYPVVHQGRVFATDGKTLFFSKSLEEVTTTTGLITSKWEECWPGDYQLTTSLNNETILGLKSDGTNLHIGTDKGIYTLFGDSPSNFSIPSIAFAQVGILSNDLWTVIYAEGQPAGFMWVTQDYKIMHSDFATYQEVGTTIYPYLQNLDIASRLSYMKMNAITKGPYSLAFLQIWVQGNPSPYFLVFDTRLRKWYRWLLPADQTVPLTGNALVGASYIYQFPGYTASTETPGSAFLFFWRGFYTTSGVLQSYRFNPADTADYGTLEPISWTVQTSWQDCGDPTAIKVVNEVEFTSDDGPLAVTLLGATSQHQFDIGGLTLKNGISTTGPIASLQTQKFYCAGAATASKYYSIAFSPLSPGLSSVVLSSFSLETYPMTRI